MSKSNPLLKLTVGANLFARLGAPVRINSYPPFITMTTVLLLSGCALTPDYQRPAAPISAKWVNPAAQAPQSADFETHFQDERLKMLIQVALKNNRDLRIATARIAEARALYGIQQADVLPNVTVYGSRTASLSPASTSFTGKPFQANRYDVGLSLVSYELDFWGRVSHLNEAAKASFFATQAAQQAFRLSLIAEVVNSYLASVELRERVALTDTTVQARATSRELINQRRIMGVSSDLDFLLADGAYQAALAEQANLQRQLNVAENALEMLIGKSVADIKDLPAGRPLAAQAIQPAMFADLPAEVLLQRPDVMAAEQKLIAAHASVGAARVAFLPRISLTGGFGTASRTLTGLFGANSQAWNFQPMLSLPLFDVGRSEGNVDLAKAREVVAVAEYEKTIQLAFREVADLLSARENYAKQLAAQQANQDTQQQRLKLVEARFNAGVSSHLEVLDAQRECYAAEQATLQVRRATLVANTQLYKALAGVNPVAQP
ncbi:MAG: efflux transporter outer membrane subunit [Gallionella sp.]|nr:efflux transporter outer membrane subunit [Gallionella sp.]